ncbi:MAG: hypothetical protein QOH04_1976 [Sphingomonadales bacterium]|jgi:hypothetical protein|nr:hypothetical protein [Sphingomonadales bacterium]
MTASGCGRTRLFSGNGKGSDQPPPKPSEALPQGGTERSGKRGRAGEEARGLRAEPTFSWSSRDKRRPPGGRLSRKECRQELRLRSVLRTGGSKGSNRCSRPRETDRAAFGPFLEGTRGKPERNSDILRRGTTGTDRGRKASAGTGLGGSAHALTGTGCQVRDSGGRRQRRPPFRFWGRAEEWAPAAAQAAPKSRLTLTHLGT